MKTSANTSFFVIDYLEHDSVTLIDKETIIKGLFLIGDYKNNRLHATHAINVATFNSVTVDRI